MLTLRATVCIEAPAAQVWEVLSALEAIPSWVPAIRHASCPAQRRGVGAVRVCELSQATVRETITEWVEGEAFTYEGVGAPLLAHASNRWSVTPEGPGRSLVTTASTVVLKGGRLGALLEPLVRRVALRAGRSSLARLKYLVEHGTPALGAGALLEAPIAC